jgi:hypothetical protein
VQQHCPLLPLQRAYGQTPLVTVPNSHCSTCVGCAKNCYDFKPRAAYQADLADPDPRWSAPRKLFAAALPGFVLGFFTLAARTDTPTPQKYPLLMLFALVSVGLFFALENMSAMSPATLTVIYAAAALNIFYWFSGPSFVGALEQITGLHAPWLRWPVSVTVAGRSTTGGRPGNAVVGSFGVVVMVSSVVSRAGQRRTTSYDAHQNRLPTRPKLIAAGGRPRPSLHGPRRADKFTDALLEGESTIRVEIACSTRQLALVYWCRCVLKRCEFPHGEARQ